MIKSVSQLWFQFDKLKVKLTANILNQGYQDTYYTLYEKDELDYLTFNSPFSIVLQYKDNFYDSSKVVHITELNIVRFVRGLTQLKSTLSNENLFIYNKGGGMKYCGTEDDIIKLSLGRGEFLELEPGVVYVDENTELPGVKFRINTKENEAGITIDEFETLLWKFQRTNIGAEGIQLLTLKALTEDKINKNIERTTKSRSSSKPSIFELKEKQEEYVEDNRRVDSKTEKPTSLLDIMGVENEQK